MKNFFILLTLILLNANTASAQSGCYEFNRNKGISAYNQGLYNDAMKYFDLAQDCLDAPKNHDLRIWINRCESAKSAQQREVEQREAAQREAAQRKQAQEREGQRQEEVTLSVSPVSLTFDANGGTQYLTIHTNASTWSTSGGHSWFSIPQNGTGTSISLTCIENAITAERRGSFVIQAGDKTITIHVEQAGKEVFTSNNTNAIHITGTWKEMITKILSANPTQKYENGAAYKGETNNEIRSILGAYLWSDGSFYFGCWFDDRNGNGIYIARDGSSVSNCPGCKYYVGKYNNDKKDGYGSCYDKDGVLIYSGNFAHDKPTETYPQEYGSSGYTFETWGDVNGDKYIGETKDGKRHGLGIYIWNNGGLWFGNWRSGTRSKAGIYISYGGAISTGIWDHTEYTQAPVTRFDIVVVPKTVPVQSKQAETSNNTKTVNNSETIHITGTWREMLKKIIPANPTQKYESGDTYKGETNNGTRNGIGAYLWYSGSFYVGCWEDKRDGNGIYIAREGFSVSNCPKCTYYVGRFTNGSKDGYGSCYDNDGVLIYSGIFAHDKPVGTYPQEYENSVYKFVTWEGVNGGKYMGETKEGKWHGLGTYIWDNGDLWFGEWKESFRSGEGIVIFYSGSIRTGHWNRDNYTQTPVSRFDIHVEQKSVTVKRPPQSQTRSYNPQQPSTQSQTRSYNPQQSSTKSPSANRSLLFIEARTTDFTLFGGSIGWCKRNGFGGYLSSIFYTSDEYQQSEDFTVSGGLMFGIGSRRIGLHPFAGLGYGKYGDTENTVYECGVTLKLTSITLTVARHSAYGIMFGFGFAI